MTSIPIYLAELPFDARALIHFVHDQGLNFTRDEDLGYAAHAWLKALLGPLSPLPYRLMCDTRSRRVPRILAYTGHSGDELIEHAQTFAMPTARAVCNLQDLRLARMPEGWKVGRRIGFEVLACPVSRVEQAEKDVFLRRVAELAPGAPPLERNPTYCAWLKSQFGGCVEIENVSVEGFRLVRMLRRPHNKARAAPRITRPQVLFRGVLAIRETEGFDRLLRRGIGRHRAFGYGMLLLRPAP